ncbi:MAG TPA: cysteine hydrolase [Chloroflexota bacterium]|jgi:nicotinamidase-related amidase|nr:cysteine hydrolase [Chloroflexota bacterium]
MSEYPIIPSKTALVFFDCLKLYYEPEDPEKRAAIKASGIVEAFKRINAASRAAGIAVFYPWGDHRPDFRDSASIIVDAGIHGEPGAGPKRSQPSAAVAGGPGNEVLDEIAPRPGDYIIKKHRWSAFFQTHMELSLRTAGIDTLMLAGGSVEVGLGNTARHARDLDFNQIVLRDACSGVRKSSVDVYMNDIFPLFTRVMTVDEAIQLIQR